MPGGDGTGPIGSGPMTGRALGTCTRYPTPRYGRSFSRGWGRGVNRRFCGQGRGIWWRGSSLESNVNPAIYKEEEKTYLENLVKNLENEIKAVKDRLQELSKENKESK
jgi:hypothetical protein